MSEMTDRLEELVDVSMQIILHAGDARLKVTEAIACAKTFDFEKADEAMKEAQHKITEAHKSQTDVIQAEASGDTYPHSLLFAHAQDTLMTINSEVRLGAEIIDVLKIIKEKLG